MKKRIAALGLSAVLTVGLLAGCGNTDQPGATQEGSASQSQSDKTYTIGINQFAMHGSLDNCKEGFLLGLAEEGFVEGVNLTIEDNNAQADTGTANQISQNYVSNKVDLICAIATPSAQSAFNAAEGKNIPVIYTAVTNPVAAGLANEDGTSTGNTTGTSDKLPVKEQLEMIREILPKAEKIGILYSTSEVNSTTTIEEYKELAGDYGFEIIDVGVSTSAEIPLATDNILGKVDCITNLTDNTIVSALPGILDKANAKKIPVFGSEVEQVRIGCVAAEGIDYIELGKQTGKMAAKVLKGEAQASEIPYERIVESSLYLNTGAAILHGRTFHESLQKRAVEIFASIGE